MNDIDVVIVNWNAGKQLAECIQSVGQYSHGLVNKILVVDNASTDGSEQLNCGLANVEILVNAENLGFAKACNIGAKKAKGDFILFLNPDAAILDNSLSKTISILKDNKYSNVGIVGIQLINSEGRVSRTCARFPTPARILIQSLGLNKIFPTFGTQMADWDHLDNRDVDQIIGAFFLVRRELFESLQGFDERFFVYFEEVDFSLRAAKLGWKSMYIAEAQAFHLGGGTSHQVKARRMFYFLRSRLQYSLKNFTMLEVTAVLIATLCFEFFSRVVLAVWKRSSANVRETMSAYGMVWRWLAERAIGKQRL